MMRVLDGSWHVAMTTEQVLAHLKQRIDYHLARRKVDLRAAQDAERAARRAARVLGAGAPPGQAGSTAHYATSVEGNAATALQQQAEHHDRMARKFKFYLRHLPNYEFHFLGVEALREIEAFEGV